MSKMAAECKRCVHYPICEWCVENTDFRLPKENGICQMCNTDFDDLEEAVSNAQFDAKQMMNASGDDKMHYMFFKGRWSALKDVAELMATKGE